MQMRPIKLATGFLVVGLLAGCTTVGPVDDVPAAVASAKTAEDHQRLAAYFENKAKRYTTEAAEHASLARGYERGFGGRADKGASAAAHCRGLEREFQAAAADARALAQLHREFAVRQQ